jgi:hypothetical protein
LQPIAGWATTAEVAEWASIVAGMLRKDAVRVCTSRT